MAIHFLPLLVAKIAGKLLFKKAAAHHAAHHALRHGAHHLGAKLAQEGVGRPSVRRRSAP